MLNNHTYKPYYFWGLMAIMAYLLLFRLGATPIYILDEAKNAECAREMMQQHNYIVPTFNGELRTDKPPLHYFFMMAAYSIFGTTAFAARFFSAIMGLLTVLITYYYTKRLLNAFAAFCTAAILVSSTHFLFEFRLSVPDPYLIFFITLGLFSAFTWLTEKSIAQLYIAAIALALATLAKGPVAIALPGLCILLWAAWQKKWSTVFTWHLIPAGILLLAIAAPWYIAVDRATNGEWTRGFFIDNNLNRFSDPQEGHGGFFLLTLLFFVIGLLPFISFIGEVINKRWKVFNKNLVRFSSIVVLAFLVFFSIASTKLPNYAMPCYPFAAIILGNYLALLLNRDISGKKYPFYILIVVTLIIPVAGYFAIAQEAEAAHINWVALLLLATPLLFIASLFIETRWQRKFKIIIVCYCIFNGIGLHLLYPTLYGQNPVSKTIDMVKKQPNILCYNIYNPGYRFYLDKNVPRAFNIPTLQHWMDSTGSGIIITRTDFLDSLKTLPLTEIARHHDIFELPTTVILQYHDVRP